MKHTEIAIRRPVTTIVAFVALALIGLIASRLLLLEKWPNIQFPGMMIQISYPNSTPEEIESRITRPVEESLATLSGIERMESESTDSQAQIFLQFGWDDIMSAKGIEARAKIDAIRADLPDDLRKITVFTGSLGDQPILVLRISSDRDLSKSFELLDRLLKRRLERIEGVSRVELQGVEPGEIRILLDPDRLAAHNIDMRRLRTLLQDSNFAVSAGRVTDSGKRLSVRPRGDFQSIDELRNLVIDGKSLRLRDVAEIELRSPDRNYGRHLDRNYAIGLNIFKATGANMVEVNDRVKAEVLRIGQLPQMQGIQIFDLDNQADNVRESLSDLLKAGLIGGLLAIVVLFLFLKQLSTTLVVTASVPFSLMITLGCMYFAGLTLNILTMMGLMLAIGMLVDNAVVVTESISRYRLMYPDKPFDATLMGVKEVGLAVIAGTATTIVIFVPFIFGTKADITVLLTHVAITIIVALIASLLIAQTLVPMMAARLPAPRPPDAGALMPRLTRWYTRGLEWTIFHPWWTTLGVIAISIVGALPLILQLVVFDSFPQDTGRRLFLDYHIEGQYSLERLETAVNQIEDYLFENQEELNIKSVYSFYGIGFGRPARAETTILLTDENITLGTKEIIKRIEQGLPEIIIGKPGFAQQQQGGNEGFSLQIKGDSTTRLNDVATDITRILHSLEGLKDIHSDAKTGDQEVRIRIDRARAAAVGLTAEEIAQSVAIAMRGENLREFRGDNSEIDVRLTFREDDKQTIEQLADLPLYTSDGNRIALGAVTRFHFGRAPQTIKRVDRQTSVIISANLKDSFTLDTLRPRVSKLMNQYALPAGYSWEFGRGFNQEEETQKIMVTNILWGIALIFLVLAALFESILYPLSIVLGSILFSIMGVFLFFAATGTVFSFMASIGIMILIGVVVNNGIVLVDHINNLRRQGAPRNDAVIKAGRDRLRPILMTVLTTILGLTPLAIGNTQVGGDGPPYYPMARAIIGGLAFSTLVSLFVVPSMYIFFDSISNWGSKVVATAKKLTPQPKAA